MYDLLFKDALVIDGTGEPPARANVAVEAGVIAAVGEDADAARKVVEAGDLVLTPGWIDLHSHFDSQVLWDSQLSPSSEHGVTTSIFGNCGIGIAPVRPTDEAHEYLARLLEGVEEISSEVIDLVVDWSWQSFPEYLDRLAKLELAADIGTYLPHVPLRLFVMGERGVDPDAVPDDSELHRLRRLTREALEAGAFGFSTTHSKSHMTSDGRPAASRNAGFDELGAIADGVRDAGRGAIEAVFQFTALHEDFSLLTFLAARSGGLVTFPVSQYPNAPDGYKEILSMIEQANKSSLNLVGQVAPRPVGVLVGLRTGRSPFSTSRRYSELQKMSSSDQIAKLRDPEIKRIVLNELTQDALQELEVSVELSDPPEYFPNQQFSLSGRAARAGVSAAELAYDVLVGGNGKTMLFLPLLNPDPAAVQQMLGHGFTVPGVSDSGAHYTRCCDASFPTSMITRWGPTRGRTDSFPLEMLVRRQTSDVAKLMGLRDRGEIRVGMRADLNLIDVDGLSLHPPELIDDLPGGGLRMVQGVDGYQMTFVAGVCTRSDGVPTGNLPGRLVRSG